MYLYVTERKVFVFKYISMYLTHTLYELWIMGNKKLNGCSSLAEKAHSFLGQEWS